MTNFIKNKKIILIAGLVACLLVVVFYSVKKDVMLNADTVIDQYAMPILKLPLSYFSDDEITWGSVNTDRDSNDKNTWKEVAIDGGYRSQPTTKITLSPDDYSQKTESLPPIKPIAEAIRDSSDPEIYKSGFEDEVKKYGDLATRFLPGDRITSSESFDVDGDGKPETILSICGYGGNHCPHQIMVLKNNKIIFSVSAGLVGLDLVKSDTGNGFSVHWVPTEGDPKWNTGLCCPPGYMDTRFVFEEGKFKPVYEQEVLYFKVENTR